MTILSLLLLMILWVCWTVLVPRLAFVMCVRRGKGSAGAELFKTASLTDLAAQAGGLPSPLVLYLASHPPVDETKLIYVMARCSKMRVQKL